MLFAWLLFSFSVYAQDCLNLDGYGEGPCIYESQKYGELEGYINFEFKQSRCDQLILNGHKVTIPGKLELIDKEQGITHQTTVHFQWHDMRKKSLLYNYEMISQKGSQTLDHVVLNGQFTQQSVYVGLFQTGRVDGDSVRIQCRLNK